tara:strand:- start:241 stop:600 length:360 start_codon:yes stop_codon:yes gene_type:complete
MKEGITVKVYRNLHKDCWSVKEKENPVKHRKELFLLGCTLRVQQAGNKKVRSEGRKNVHAYVKGILLSGYKSYSESKVKVTYNPYTMESFMLVQGNNIIPIHEAGLLHFTKEGKLFKIN